MIKYKVLEKITEYGNYILPEKYGYGKTYINFIYENDNIEKKKKKGNRRVNLSEMSDLMSYISCVKEVECNSKYIKKVKSTISSYLSICVLANPNSSSSIQKKIDTICGNNPFSKDLIHDFKLCLDNYIINKREMILKEIFFERIKYSMPNQSLKDMKGCSSNYLNYFVIPLNGDIFTTDVRNMMLVKSCRLNLFSDIINATLQRIREGNIVPPKDSKYYQLDNVLTEDMIPFV